MKTLHGASQNPVTLPTASNCNIKNSIICPIVKDILFLLKTHYKLELNNEEHQTS